MLQIHSLVIAVHLALLGDLAAAHGRPDTGAAIELDSHGHTKNNHVHRAFNRKSGSLLRSSIQGDSELEVFQTDIDLPGLETVRYDPAFLEKCLHEWQEKCHARYSHDHENDQLLCESHLQRHHLKSRLLVPREHVRAHFDHSPALQQKNKTIYEDMRLPRFTEEGYGKAPLPPDLHQRFFKWFRANRHKAIPEESPVTGMWCDNDYDNDDWILPWAHDPESHALVKEIRDFLVPHLEEWTQQQIDTENPIIYGVRMYHAGAICAMHTDANSDHIISVLYHIDDTGLKDDWTLDVIDHGGHARSVVSRPGELIYYESTTTPHGRKSVLNGEEFANIFFHFRPHGWIKARDAAFKGMIPFDANQAHLSRFVPNSLTPAIFHKEDKCLPYGNGPQFSGAYNTSLMSMCLTHNCTSVSTPLDK